MKKFLTLTLALAAANAAAAADNNNLKLEDVFQLEYASQPAVHPEDGYTGFVRNYMDIMSDRRLGNLWRVDNKGQLRPLTNGQANDHSPNWSPDGKTLAYVSNASGSNQIHLYWTDSRASAAVTRLTGSPSNLSWSPDGKFIAFSMFTPSSKAPPVSLPGKP